MKINNCYTFQNPQYTTNFKALNNLDACFYDIAFTNKYFKEVCNKLPKFLRNQRDLALDNLSRKLLTHEYFQETLDRNWSLLEGDSIAHVALEMLDFGEDVFVHERAEILLTKTYFTLVELFKGKKEIIIPFSGGRDSSALLTASLAFFPDKKYTLITCINGMTEGQENVLKQVEYIKRLFTNQHYKPDIDLIFLDVSKDIKKYVIDSAHKDNNDLGAPALCSGCKMIMEKSIWNYLLNNRSKYKQNKKLLLMGYNQNQANQSWTEQTLAQKLLTQKTAEQYGIDVVSPLYYIVEAPYDSRILLASLGIPLKHHKSEMKCSGGGMNPKMLDLKRQLEFLTVKNDTTNFLITKKAVMRYSKFKPLTPAVNLQGDVMQLKNDKEYTANAYMSKKDKPEIPLQELIEKYLPNFRMEIV